MAKHSRIGKALKLTVAAAAFALANLAHSAIIVASLEDFTNGGGFFGQITLEDVAPNTISVTLDISDPINAGLSQGDILGVWFDVNDESILLALNTAFQSPDFGGVFQNVDPAGIISAAIADANNVNSVGSANNNLEGGGGIGEDFDIGIALGTQGATQGFNQTISFDLVFAGLSTSLFTEERVGMRVQSIESTVFAGGSSKLLGDNPPPSTVPTPGSLALLGLGLVAVSFGKRLGSKSRQA